MVIVRDGRGDRHVFEDVSEDEFDSLLDVVWSFSNTETEVLFRGLTLPVLEDSQIIAINSRGELVDQHTSVAEYSCGSKIRAEDLSEVLSFMQDSGLRESLAEEGERQAVEALESREEDTDEEEAPAVEEPPVGRDLGRGRRGRQSRDREHRPETEGADRPPAAPADEVAPETEPVVEAEAASAGTEGADAGAPGEGRTSRRRRGGRRSRRRSRGGQGEPVAEGEAAAEGEAEAILSEGAELLGATVQEPFEAQPEPTPEQPAAEEGTPGQRSSRRRRRRGSRETAPAEATEVVGSATDGASDLEAQPAPETESLLPATIMEPVAEALPEAEKPSGRRARGSRSRRAAVPDTTEAAEVALAGPTAPEEAESPVAVVSPPVEVPAAQTATVTEAAPEAAPAKPKRARKPKAAAEGSVVTADPSVLEAAPVEEAPKPKRAPRARAAKAKPEATEAAAEVEAVTTALPETALAKAEAPPKPARRPRARKAPAEVAAEPEVAEAAPEPAAPKRRARRPKAQAEEPAPESPAEPASET
ncbi:MAG TPA: hypothetical protein VGN26_00690 [Armatimonadota bacterium]